MLEALNTNIAEYIKLSPEELSARGILGRLCGIIADYKNPTRNGRLYSEDLWDNVFNSDLMLEKIATKTLFGELGHPLDGRTETDMEKIAICLSEQPKKGKDGKLYGIFDILNTPNGKILKALCDYGTTIGVSSRGEGDLITDNSGLEAVDPKTYSCECWDAVLTPSVASARMKYEGFNESLDTKKSLTESLSSLVEKASEEDRLIMSETLNNLGINLTEATTAANVNYEDLSKEAKATLKDAYGNITNNKDLEGALKKAVEGLKKDDIMAIAKMLKKYDPDFVKDHTKVKDLAEKPIKDTTADLNSVSIPDEPIAPVEDTALPSVDATSEDTNDSLEQPGLPEVNLEEPVEEALDNNENKIVLNNIDQQPQQNNVADDIYEEPIKEEVDNSKSDLISTLQEALISRLEMETELLKLNERLSVCYAKEAKLEELIAQLRESIKAKELEKTTTSSITESLKKKSSKQVAMLNEANGQIRNLNERCLDIVDKYNTLAENYNNKSSEIKKLTEDIDTHRKTIDKLQSENSILSENLAKAKEESLQLTESYSEKLEKSNNLVEKYKAVANKAVNKYIDSQALKLDITSNEIKNRLPSNYSFNDIDKICESLSATKVSMNMLPFRNPSKLRENMKLEIKGQKEPILKNEQYNVDDEVDDSLKILAGM